jgi:hypothetical protein
LPEAPKDYKCRKWFGVSQWPANRVCRAEDKRGLLTAEENIREIAGGSAVPPMFHSGRADNSSNSGLQIVYDGRSFFAGNKRPMPERWYREGIGLQMICVRQAVIAALLLTAGSANAAQLKGSEAITMPIFGDSQHVMDVWQKPDGHLVFQIFFRNGGHAFTDFFDTQTGTRLFPARAEEMANSHDDVLERSLRPKELTKVKTSLFSLAGPPGYSVKSGGYEGGSLCGVQYSSPIEIRTKDMLYRFAVYSKVAQPRKFNSPCDTGEVRLHYREASVYFVSADESGFWVLLRDQSAMARFDWSGTSKFFNGRADPVLVPYEEMNAVREHVEDHGPAQKGYDRAEQLIQRYSRRQLAAAPRPR